MNFHNHGAGGSRAGQSGTFQQPSIESRMYNVEARLRTLEAKGKEIDEEEERKLFEAAKVCGRDGFARRENGDYLGTAVSMAWHGWLACARSRSKTN